MIHLLSPGGPAQRTGGYLYNARMVDWIRGQGRDVDVVPLTGDWPAPEAADVAAAVRRVDALPDGPVVADGLMWTAIADAIRPRRVLALVHSPLWREGGPALRAPEEAALARATAVVCTSGRTAADLAIPSLVVEPGTDPAPQAVGSGAGRLLCVATVTRRKAHDVLLDAVTRLDVPWTLHCAGSLDRDRRWAQALRDRAPPGVTWLGELQDATLAEAYHRADLLVQCPHYEGWGMALAEGLVRGLPVVSTPAGLLDDRDRQAVRLVPPGDPAALADAITTILVDRDAAVRLGRRGRGLGLPDWPTQGTRLLAAIDDMEGS